MTDPSVPFAVFVGLTVRMMIPILITIIIVLALTKLDRHWKNEAVARPAAVVKPECWEMQHCAASAREDCPGYRSELPCWQVFRLSSGYLNEKCLGCPVFVRAPIPLGS